MPAPQIPLAKAKLTGAMAKDPQRFRDRSEPKSSGPVGPPPDFLTAKEKKAWKDFAGRWSWITADDEPQLVALVQMRVLIEDRSIAKTAAMYNTYRLMMSDFGGTPVTRSKVYLPKEDDGGDPFADFGKPN